MNFSSRLSSRSKVLLIVSFVFILMALPLFVFLASNKSSTDNRSQASEEASNLTNDLIISKKDPVKAISNAKQRKTNMKKLAETNPESFLLNSVDSEAKNSLPAEAKANVEAEITKTGYITLADAENEKSGYIFTETDANDRPLNSYILSLTPELKDSMETDSKVTINGYIIDDTLVPFKISKSTVLAAADVSTGNHKVAIIPVNFNDKNNQEYTKSELNQRFFTSSNSVANYYSSVSNGKINMTGKIFDPVKLNTNASAICKRPDALNYLLRYVSEDADQKVEARGESLSGYDHRVYIFPRLGPTPKTSAPCTFVAQATIGNQQSPSRNFARIIVNGHYFQNNLDGRTNALIHEMGHNLGLGHASTLSCGSKQIDLYGKCTDEEYGEHSDIMGFQYDYSPQPGGLNKYKLGYLPDSNVATLNQVGTKTVDLHTSSKKSNDTQLIKIPRKNVGDSLFLEYRQPVGFDKNLPTNVTRGALVKIGNTNKIDTTNNIYKTFLLNANPGSSTNVSPTTASFFNNSALKDGQEFYDSINDIRIKQVSHNGEKVTLTINVGEPPCVRQNPTVSIEPPSKSGKPGTQRTYTLSIKNRDLDRCGSSAYSLKINASADSWKTSFGGGNSVTVGSGNTANKTFNITPPNNATDGQKSLSVNISARNNTLSINKSFKYVVINSGNSQGDISKAPTKKPTSLPTKPPTRGPSKTPTSIPTALPIPSISLDPQSTYVGLSIGLQGIGKTGTNTQPNLISGNQNPIKKDIDVNLKIYGKENTPDEVKGKAYYDSSSGKYIGTFKLNKLPGQEISNIFVSVPSYLSQRIDAKIVPNQANQVITFNLSGGDIDENGERNLLDWNLLNACSIFKFNNPRLCPDGSSIKKNADMNSDGFIDQSDITLFYQELFGSRKY